MNVSQPLLSVVIPSSGDAGALVRCLESLAAQDVRHPLEVVVVLDGVSPPRGTDLDRLMERTNWPWRIGWIEQRERQGPGAARNRGVEDASGDYLLFLDDDMVASPTLAREHLALLEREDVAVLGAIDTDCLGYGGAYRYFVESFWGERHHRLTRDVAEVHFDDCFSGNLSLRTATFRRLNGFDATLRRGEDLELGIRLERRGVPLRYAPAAVANQRYRKSPAQSIRDAGANGQTAARLWRENPDVRHRLCFAVASHGRDNARWMRAWALRSGWRLEDHAEWLAELAPSRLTKRVAWFMHDVAHARGLREELGDDDLWTALSDGTLVLCYHRFTRGVGSEFAVSVQRFAKQLEYLGRRGYRFLTASEWARAWHAAEPPRGATAVVTIDDAHDSVFELAAPILERLGVRPTLYVVHGLVGSPGHLSAPRLRELAAAGWEIGSHTTTHPVLEQLAEDAQRAEICISRGALAETLGIEPPATFAYPYGSYNDSAVRLAREAGYRAAFTVDRGYAYLHTPAWEVPRFVVDGRWPEAVFRLAFVHGVRGFGLP